MKIKMFVLLGLIAVMLGGCNSTLISKMSYPADFKTVVVKYSKENNISPYIVYGIIKRESKFIHDAKSSKGAMGLMQLTKSTAEWTAEYTGLEKFNTDNMFEPSVNIRLGCAYFAHLLKVYDQNTHLALCAYNAGMGNVNEWLDGGILNKDNVDIKKIPYEETRKYVEDVLKYAKHYEKLYPDLAE